MKILLRHSNQKEWQKVEPRTYDNEAQLEALLAESPDLLPVDGTPVVFFKGQVRIGANKADLVGVDAAGSITVVECKLDSNRDARRVVIAQILEYASQLWGLEYEEFEGLLVEGEERSLGELVRQRTAPEWSEVAFRAGVERCLAEGDFRLVIAISGMNPELKGILDYLNACRGVRVEALELRQFSEGTNEVLIPTLYGSSPSRVGTRASRASATRRTLEEVFSSAPDAESARHLRTIVNAWVGAGHEAIAGTSGISFRANVRGNLEWVFMAHNPEFLLFHRKNFERRGIPKSAVDEFFTSLAKLEGIESKKLASQSAPRVYLNRISDSDVQRLLEAMLRLVELWKEAAATSPMA